MTPKVVSSSFFRNVRPKSLDGKTSNDAHQLYLLKIVTSMISIFWGLSHALGSSLCPEVLPMSRVPLFFLTWETGKGSI